MSEDKEFKPKGEDEIRQEVIDTHKLDAEEQKELIDEITKDKLSQQEALGTAIRQKKDWRQKATDFEKGKNYYKKNPPKNQSSQQKVGETNQEYEKRLSALEFATAGEVSETVEKAMKEHKKVYPDKSYKEIKEMSFIQNMIKEEAEAKELDDASISPDGKNAGEIRKNFKGMTITEFNKQYDAGTEEGGKMYDKWKEDNK